jgi:hypothetical protein
VLSCPEFEDRLYDEDARRALEGRAAVPHDIAAHRDGCAACARLWAEAIDDVRALPQMLMAPAPPALETRLRARFAAWYPAPMRGDWTQSAVWAAIGAATVVSMASYLPEATLSHGPLTWSAVGAVLALALHQARALARE